MGLYSLEKDTYTFVNAISWNGFYTPHKNKATELFQRAKNEAEPTLAKTCRTAARVHTLISWLEFIPIVRQIISLVEYAIHKICNCSKPEQDAAARVTKTAQPTLTEEAATGQSAPPPSPRQAAPASSAIPTPLPQPPVASNPVPPTAPLTASSAIPTPLSQPPVASDPVLPPAPLTASSAIPTPLPQPPVASNPVPPTAPSTAKSKPSASSSSAQTDLKAINKQIRELRRRIAELDHIQSDMLEHHPKIENATSAEEARKALNLITRLFEDSGAKATQLEKDIPAMGAKLTEETRDLFSPEKELQSINSQLKDIRSIQEDCQFQFSQLRQQTIAAQSQLSSAESPKDRIAEYHEEMVKQRALFMERMDAYKRSVDFDEAGKILESLTTSRNLIEALKKWTEEDYELCVGSDTKLNGMILFIQGSYENSSLNLILLREDFRKKSAAAQPTAESSSSARSATPTPPPQLPAANNGATVDNEMDATEMQIASAEPAQAARDGVDRSETKPLSQVEIERAVKTEHEQFYKTLGDRFENRLKTLDTQQGQLKALEDLRGDVLRIHEDLMIELYKNPEYARLMFRL